MNTKELSGRFSKKHLIGLTALGGLILVIFILMTGGWEKPMAPAQNKKSVEVNLLGNADLEKEHWRATAEKDLENLKTQQHEMTEQLKSLRDEMKKKEEGAKLNLSGSSNPKSFPPMPQFPQFPTGKPPAQTKSQSPPSAPFPDPILIFGPEAGAFAPVITDKGKPVEGHLPQDQPYLPSGSFVSGVLLSGLDAPAGVNASKEPHPILIKLSDLAVLPNRFRFDIRDCFIIGEGYGDLSSERAYIRTTTLSCVRNDGSSVDMPLKAFVAGEDGKVGLRGRVVSKQGQFLAKALVAGFAEGMADVLRVGASTVSVSPLGATETINPGQAVKAGAMGGTSRALERLAQHYIDMAERLFPVIEIDAGRKAEVVVLKGMPLVPVDQTQEKR